MIRHKQNSKNNSKLKTMKKIINSLFASLSIGNSVNTLTVTTVSESNKIFTSADLWNIQRQGKTRSTRRFI